MNPKKLLNSKWTAVQPEKKEKHFLVTKVFLNGEDPQIVEDIIIEAVFTKNSYRVNWRELKKEDKWRQGWL